MAQSASSGEALDAQGALIAHLTPIYGPGVGPEIVAAILAAGRPSRLAHRTTAALGLPGEVVAAIAELGRTPGSGVILDDQGHPALADRASAARVLVALSRAAAAAGSAAPSGRGGALDCALLVDGSNHDRIFFGIGGPYVDAVSAAIMLAGRARRTRHLDPGTPEFLHSRSLVWCLAPTPLGLAAAQWGDVAEIHVLAKSGAPAAPAVDRAMSTGFEKPKYAWFPPDAPAHRDIPEFDALALEATRLLAGPPSVGDGVPPPSARVACGVDGPGSHAAGAHGPVGGPGEANGGGGANGAQGAGWWEGGGLSLDPALLRAAEAFAAHLGDRGRIAEGTILIGGPGSGLAEEAALEVCADLALVLSAVARTDGGADAGGPFGTVLWHRKSGAVTVGKNQVVPSRSAVDHGERVGLFLAPGLDDAVVVTTGEPCAMCHLACAARGMDIVFVVPSPLVERNTPFQEGHKDWGAFPGRALGPETYTGRGGAPLVHGRPWLKSRAGLGTAILRAWTDRGRNYAV